MALAPNARRPALIDTVIGASLCVLTAMLLSLFVRDFEARTAVPLLFIAVIILIAMRFGAVSGAVGALAAALVFSYMLFTPVGSMRVQKQEARDNLMWMLMLGVPAGYFAWTQSSEPAGRDGKKAG